LRPRSARPDARADPLASARINEMIAGSCAALTRSISAASSFFTLPIA
jgi:hypothetical protein